MEDQRCVSYGYVRFMNVNELVCVMHKKHLCLCVCVCVTPSRNIFCPHICIRDLNTALVTVAAATVARETSSWEQVEMLGPE